MSVPTSYELKFTVDGRDVAAISRWLGVVCQPDPLYPYGAVSSIYFDTPALARLYEKINGDYLKTKIRLRWYDVPNRPAGPSFLEAKFRIGVRRRKVRVATEYSPDRLQALPLHDQALRRIPYGLRPLGVPVPEELRPVLVVRYTRDRFVDPVTRVRISFDSDISVPAVNHELLPTPPALPLPVGVVEVKGMSSELPISIRRLTSIGGRKSSFSKFLACYEHATLGLGRHVRIATR